MDFQFGMPPLSMSFLQTEIESLLQARVLARKNGYDCVISKDVVNEDKEIKVYYTGPWEAILRELNETDTLGQRFYEEVFSDPVGEQEPKLDERDTDLGEDGGMFGARFVVDIDFRLCFDQVDTHVERVASLFDKCYEMAGGAFYLGHLKKYTTEEMKTLLYSLLNENTWEEFARRVRLELQSWVDEGLQLLGFSDLERSSVQIADASKILPARDGEPAITIFSLRLHYNKILLRQHAVDGATLARNLNVVMSACVLIEFIGNKPKSELFWIRCILLRVPDPAKWSNPSLSRQFISEIGITNEAIYSSRCSMRLWFSSVDGAYFQFNRRFDDGTVSTNVVQDTETFISDMNHFRISHSAGAISCVGVCQGIQFSKQDALAQIHPEIYRRLATRNPLTNFEHSRVIWNERELDDSFISLVWDVFSVSGPAESISNNCFKNGFTPSVDVPHDIPEVQEEVPSGLFIHSKRNGFCTADEFMSKHILEVIQAKERIASKTPRHNTLSTENAIHSRAKSSLSFCRRVFVLVALVDHCAALNKCTDPIQKETIKKQSYWSEIERWVSSSPPMDDKDNQLNMKCILEEIQGLQTIEKMFDTFLPSAGAIMENSPENIRDVSSTLESWKPTKVLLANSGNHTRTAYRNLEDDPHICKLLKSNSFKPRRFAAKKGKEVRKQTSSKDIGNQTRRYVCNRVPISWKPIPRNNQEVVIVRPWCCSTLALVASGMHDVGIPGNRDTLLHCKWFFFTEIRQIGESALRYRRPMEESDETEAMRAVDAEIDAFRSKFDEASRMKLTFSKEFFYTIFQENATNEVE